MKSKIISDALEVFVHGFGFTRSFTHPYIGEWLDPLWALRDAPRTSGNYRTEEWIAYDVPPAEIDKIARQHTRGRFTICTVLDNGEPDRELRSAFKEMKYRLNATEPMMVHDLAQVPEMRNSAEIVRVEDEELMARVNKDARSRQILPEHLAFDDLLNAPIRQYVALIDGEIVGRVASLLMRRENGNHAAWVSNMYVAPAFRRRGIATALMSRMLNEDREAGAKQSILLASHAGAKLYPVLGYEQIGMMYIYTPSKNQ